MKDSLRNDPRYKCVKHEDREILFNEYISELKAAEEALEREAKSKKEEQVIEQFFYKLVLSMLVVNFICWSDQSTSWSGK